VTLAIRHIYDNGVLRQGALSFSLHWRTALISTGTSPLIKSVAELYSMWIKPKRLLRSAMAFKPSTIEFPSRLVQRKYQLQFFAKASSRAAKRSE
jgi:hypothetical protein